MATCYRRWIDAESGQVLLDRLELADTFWRRTRGLMLRSGLAPSEGLLLKPCRAIHTHWMRFAIDVAWLDDEGVVLAICPALRPWKFSQGISGARAAVETAAGVLASRLRVGTRTQLVAAPDPKGIGRSTTLQAFHGR